MNPKEQDYIKHDFIASAMGWTGNDGVYTTKLGLVVDTTAAEPDRLSFGYCAAAAAGHITIW